MAGLLGPASPTDRKGPNISDTPVGIGGTTQWKLAGLVCHSTPYMQHMWALVFHLKAKSLNHITLEEARKVLYVRMLGKVPTIAVLLRFEWLRYKGRPGLAITSRAALLAMSLACLAARLHVMNVRGLLS